MIEINLLPPQYRTVERTPLPIMLGLMGAGAVCAIMLLVLFGMGHTTRKLEEKKGQLTLVRDQKAKEVEDIKKIERELAESQGRVDTVLGIAESKVYWAMKLDQFVRALPSYAWIENLNFDGGRVVMSCKARGTSLQRYTELRQRFRNDTNFAYHFESMPPVPIDVVNPGAQYLEPAVLSFQVMLPLKAGR